MACVSDLFISDEFYIRLDPGHDPLAVGVLLSRRQHRHGWHVDGVVVVEIPPFRERYIGIMGVDEGDHHHEGVVRRPRVLKDFSFREKPDFLVIFDLEGGGGDTRFDHAVHVMVPLVDALVRQFPIRRPGEIAGIDVGRDALVEAVQLIRADEMHLAGEAGMIAEFSEMVGEGRDRACELGGIVIGGNAGHMLP